MFVPVSCTKCGQPFQVPEASLGKPAACPWCQAVVTALPVGAAPTADAPPPEAPKPASPSPSAPEVLSLDDPPPIAKPNAAIAGKPVPVLKPESEPAEGKPAIKFNARTVFIGLGVVVLVGAVTFFVLGYGEGRIPDSAWSEFTPPDGSCTLQMPGAPTEEEVLPITSSSVSGGKRYATRTWYSKTAAWVAWYDVNPTLAKDSAKDKGEVFATPVLEAERDREKAQLEGSITREVIVRLNTAWGLEVHMDTPRGKVVERLILVAGGPRPRLYVYGLQAKNLTHDGPAVRRMFTSFKVNE